jgi:hypothetical protein
MAKNADGPPSGRMGFGARAALDQGIPPEMILCNESESVRRTNEAKNAREDRKTELAAMSHDPRLKAYADELRKQSPMPSVQEMIRLIRERARRYAREREAVRKSKL